MSARKKLSQDQIQEVIALAKERVPQVEIARRIGCCPSTVSEICKKNGLQYKRSSKPYRKSGSFPSTIKPDDPGIRSPDYRPEPTSKEIDERMAGRRYG